MYTWYESTDATDVAFFTGNYDYQAAAGATYELTTAELTEVTGGLQTYVPNAILFHMEIANPVAGAIPTYDGFWHLAKPTLKDV